MMRVDSPNHASTAVSPELNLVYTSTTFQSSIAAFPTTRQPVLDTTMKCSFIHKFTTDMHTLGELVHYIEGKIEECTNTANHLTDAYEESREDNLWIKAKLVDLQDCLLRNNVKWRGFSGSVHPHELQGYACDMISTLLPDFSPVVLTIDRIHHIPKPQHLADSVPRDVLMLIHFFSIKEQLLCKARLLNSLPAPYTDVQIFLDLSQYTLQIRRQLKMIIKALRNPRITYIWRYPASLLITHNGVSHIVSSMEVGPQHLHFCSIITEPSPGSNAPQESHRKSQTG